LEPETDREVWKDAVFENIEKACNNLLYFGLGEFGAYPDDETGYFGHMGFPPGGPQTTFNPT